VIDAYESVSSLYPFVPPLSHWRAWEMAAYRRYRLAGRILDLGCGDGRYFRLLWPDVKSTLGIDSNPGVAELARSSGVYEDVIACEASSIPVEDASFDMVFANCSLEHMDDLDSVLAEVSRCLRPGGTLLCSVVTDRFLQWSLLQTLVDRAGYVETAQRLREQFRTYHNLVNPLSVEEWTGRLADAGLVVDSHVPIMPMYNTGIFLVMDSLWHIERPLGGELGDLIHPFLSANPRFPHAFGTVLKGLMDLETDWETCSGAVLRATRRP
jgi:ubiquinone/menaquinone biosynthesis C-methylase UbiE